MLLIIGFLVIIMKKKWSIGLMTGTANDGNIDIAALQTDGDKIINFGPFELFSYKDKEIKSIKVIDLILLALEKNQIFIGYILKNELHLNPPKSKEILMDSSLEIVYIS